MLTSMVYGLLSTQFSICKFSMSISQWWSTVLDILYGEQFGGWKHVALESWMYDLMKMKYFRTKRNIWSTSFNQNMYMVIAGPCRKLWISQNYTASIELCLHDMLHVILYARKWSRYKLAALREQHQGQGLSILKKLKWEHINLTSYSKWG